ncbi:uncharacterized protein EAF01_010912 [Botrytis porri]|uniref:Uncharacterized protein n=1 Tax=Botrytis porri TaxID=87229 RepID=A0A4Z1K6K9_9HELO|nr:uncharacterized protein EAF01_010912 [Botrytis porri]KAF7889419.1 hypothetical protein EAF01_010912 [Botrytis porri]TGO81288.1 hypothetical protein BPOR_1225g00030 [Botrytis porri]
MITILYILTAILAHDALNLLLAHSKVILDGFFEMKEKELQHALNLKKEESEQALTLAKYNFEEVCAARDRYKDELAEMKLRNRELQNALLEKASGKGLGKSEFDGSGTGEDFEAL